MKEFSAKYDPGVQVKSDSVLCLHRNENRFVGPDWTVEAARALVEKAAIASYPDATSLPLREALAELYEVEADNVFVGNGADEVLADLLRLLRESYDSVSLLDVCFKVYLLLAERFGYRQEVLAGNTFETGAIEVQDFRGLAVVDSPNGITGRSLPGAELMRLARDERSFLIWDNVYGEYGGDDLPTPRPKNVAVVRSFSKFYGLAGLRVGYCIADAALVSELLARKDAFNVNGFAQVMALEALRRRPEFLALRDQVLECRGELMDGLSRLGFRVQPSDCIAVLATHPVHAAASLQKELLKRNVAVRRFSDAATSNFIRITVAPRPELERLLDALGEIVNRQPTRSGP